MAWRLQQGGAELPGAGQRQQEAATLGRTRLGDELVICCRVAAAGRISAVLGHAHLYHAAAGGHNAGRVWEMAAGAGAAAGTAAGGIAVVAAVDRISPVEALRHAVAEPNLVSVKMHKRAG